MTDEFFGLMKPYEVRRSRATSNGMRQNQAGIGICQPRRRIREYSHYRSKAEFWHIFRHAALHFLEILSVFLRKRALPAE